MAIHMVTASTAFAAGVNPVKGLNKIKRKKAMAQVLIENFLGEIDIAYMVIIKALKLL